MTAATQHRQTGRVVEQLVAVVSLPDPVRKAVLLEYETFALNNSPLG